jgi:3-hydroxyacyl-CoA dehydrogenase/enoyl-CoA hydratase/3-hydroxybutyryl-CoA epimerase
MTDSAVRYDKDDEGIVTLTLDDPGQSANTMNAAYRQAMGQAVARLKDDGKHVCGVIVTSAKRTFFAGGDLKEIVAVTRDTLPGFIAHVAAIKRQLRALETLGKPVVAVIAGAALGGGWEIALAAHRRIVVDDPRIVLGLPEVTLGLLPGGGGVVRSVCLLGLEAALPLLLEGRQLKPAEAHALGLVHELAPNPEAALEQARAWIRCNPQAVQPWDAKRRSIPVGASSLANLAQTLSIAPAAVRAKSHGNLPAPEAILSAAVEGSLLDFDAAQKVEERYFARLVVDPISRNLIKTLWFQLNAIRAGGSRPKGPAPLQVKKLGVIGAGMMGAGIAYVSASAGIEVVLKDVSKGTAEKGKSYSTGLLDRRLVRGQVTQHERDAILARIHATDRDADFAGCDLIIEAVFEDRALKHKATKAAQHHALPDAVIASNTSTLPITGLAEAIPQPHRFIGLHFFSPVDKMQLVEIVRGQRTDAATLARAFDYVRQIKKIPIVVNDARGFYTTRVFIAFVNEGIRMLTEGVSPALIENVAVHAGMPVGPLTVSDEVSLTLLQRVRRQTEADLATEGKQAEQCAAYTVVDRMVDELKRPGRAAGAGFYEYPAGGTKYLWPELGKRFATGNADIAPADIRDRYLFVQALEAVRALDEGVLNSVADANVGGIFGIGYPPWTGGPLQFIDYCGATAFVDRARHLADRYGPRFEPRERLLRMAADGGRFMD